MPFFSKNFYFKLAVIPFGAMIITILVTVFKFGIGYFFTNWKEFLVLLLFLTILIIFFGFLASKRLERFFAGFNEKNIFLLAFSFLANFLFIVFSPPRFLLDFHPFEEDLSVLLVVVISWLVFPFITRNNFLSKNVIFLIPAFLMYIIILVSFVLVIIIDFLNIFYRLIS